VYFANDAAGTLLHWRGWTIHDRELTLFDEAPLPEFQYDLINPVGPFRYQEEYYKPLDEIDGRPGFYAGVDVDNENWGRVSFHYYDNNADADA
jgi:hypothetical protein